MIIYKNSELYTKELLVLNIQFFAEGGEKTEQPTSRKREKAREEGQVAKSMELNTAFLLLFMFSGIKIFAPYMYQKVLEIFQHSYVLFPMVEDVFTPTYILKFIPFILFKTILILTPLFAIALFTGLIINFAQVGWHPTLKPLQPKFSRLNPIQGFKKIISIRSLVELVKTLIKLSIIGLIMYNSISKQAHSIFLLLDMSVMQIIQFIGNIAINSALAVGGFFVLVAIVDFMYQKYDLNKQLKMSKQEVKEESKMSEGNPEVKGKIRQKMREASMRRMMQDLPKADVIITNPTHYAVAILYDKDKGAAPIVLAKGVDYLAQRIKGIANEYEIQIVENKPLARTIYATVDIGDEIPPELYQAVAEVLAFVYSLKQSK